uniref:Uncharacterized protein n=1 Tax=Arion vulgaris TaxID=1028688 RepID=A0A0B6ZXT3_9EUPU
MPSDTYHMQVTVVAQQVVVLEPSHMGLLGLKLHTDSKKWSIRGVSRAPSVLGQRGTTHHLYKPSRSLNNPWHITTFLELLDFFGHTKKKA